MASSTAKPTVRGQRQFTAIAGEHFVAAELSKRGWVATLTAKNTPGFDVLAAQPTGYTVCIDVKTRSTAYRYAWRLGSGVHISGKRDFVVLVDLGEEDDPPDYWIIPARTAQTLTTNNQIRDKDVGEFQDRWDLLMPLHTRSRRRSV
jgi:hypothetical protein